MPLITISAKPFTGKTTFAKSLQNYISNNQSEKACIIISDEDKYRELELTRDEVYESTHVLEKRLRGDLKAATEKALANKNNIVILDHGNYIKSFRYELYCLAKSTKEKSCVVFLSEPLHNIHDTESDYSEDIYQALSFRFEEPIGDNRWDKPLIKVSVDDLSSEDSKNKLFENILNSVNNASGQKVKQNNSTIAPSNTNLKQMEKITQEVLDLILKARKNDEIEVKLSEDVIISTPSKVEKTDNDLRRYRREFTKYIKAQIDDLSRERSSDDYRRLFVSYLGTKN